MKLKQKRPVGITILALVHLWIGCLGTIVFPFVAFSSETSLAFQRLGAAVIHSESMLKIGAEVFFSVWFLAYVAYAVIGFGLWKLRNWARKALLALNVIFIFVCVLSLLFFAKMGTLAVVIVIGIAIPCAWIVWYLKRPRVCYAFGAAPWFRDGVPVKDPSPCLSKAGKFLVAGAILATFALFCGSLMVTGESMFRSSEIYEMTLKEAEGSRCVAAALGVPLTPGWTSSGNMREGSEDGSADLGIPVRGPKGKGRLEMSAEKQKGVWKITSLVLARDSERIQIEPPVSGTSCQ
jgi:hypothetical protein